MEFDDNLFLQDSIFYISEPEGITENRNTMHGILQNRRKHSEECESYYWKKDLQNLHSSETIDIIDDEFIKYYYGTGMCTRSRITDILLYHCFLIVLTKKGACIAYNRYTLERYMFINPTKFDTVQTIYLNTLNDSLLVVSYRQKESNYVLQCRSLTLQNLIDRDIHHSQLLFPHDIFTYPSYFEFDEYNEIIITYCACLKEYKLWKQKDYSLLYSIEGDSIHEVRIGRGLLLISQNVEAIPSSSVFVMPIMIIRITTGDILYRAHFYLHNSSEIEFFEIFEEFIFIKQKKNRIVVYNTITSSIITMHRNSITDTRLMIFLNTHSLFLVFSENAIDFYDNALQKYHSIEKTEKYANNSQFNIVFLAPNQDICVYYYSDVLHTGKIEIFNTLSGQQLLSRDSRGIYPDDNYALEDVSGLYYDFCSDVLYTGKRIDVVLFQGLE